MPWKLGDPDEPTVVLNVRMPLSMKKWLEQKRGGASAYVRKLLAAKMAKRTVPDEEKPTDLSEFD